MKTAGLVFLLLLAIATASAQTNQSWRVCRNPVRVFGSHRVDLAPLFDWWGHQPLPTNATSYTKADIDIDTNSVTDADRPLAAWHRVTGTYVGTLSSGSWAVDAVIYTSPTAWVHTRIVLNHPPALEQQNYEALKSDLAQANQQIAAEQAAYNAAEKARQKDQQLVEAYSRSISKVASTGVNVYTQAAAQQQQAATTAAAQKKQLEGVRGEIEKQLKTIPAIDGNYMVDWFAVMLGRSKQGLPIYDMGLVSPTPP
jgi:hypothetical protein